MPTPAPTSRGRLRPRAGVWRAPAPFAIISLRTNGRGACAGLHGVGPPITTNLQHAGGDHYETLLRYRCGTVAARAYRLLALAAGFGPGRRGMGHPFRRLEPERLESDR